MPIKPLNIDGATPLDDYSSLKLSWISTHAQLDAAEADNIRLAADRYLIKKRYAFPQWFTIPHFNLVHKAMFGKVWNWASHYRRTGKNVGVPPHQISIELKKLADDIQFWGDKNSFDAIETAARVHHRLVWIHPYENGNGRHGRFIGDMILRAFGHEPILWPRLTDNGEARRLYIEALKSADEGNFSALVDFFIQHRPPT